VKRLTLASDVEFEGLGLHTGVTVKVRVRPAEDGIHFRAGQHRWEARPENVTDTTRCTKLGEVSTIEHIMSAFAGLEITDVEIEVEGGELPALGGCSIGYVDAFRETGLKDLGEFEPKSPFKRVYLEADHVKIAIGKGDGHWGFTYDVGERWPHQQTFECPHIIDCYEKDIAPARTFALAEEIPMVVQMGLGKGLDESSALILGEGGYKNDARFQDEPARHKLLDFLGDLYLAGVPARLLNASATGSGHRTHVQAAKLLLEHLS